MEHFTSAEAVTRYLRLKNTTASDAETAATLLWQGKFPVHLPNTAQFLFELLCDRMGEFSHPNFAQWKKSPGLWRLWREIYGFLGRLGEEARNAAFARVKLPQIVSAVLDLRVEEQQLPEESEKLTKKNGKRQKVAKGPAEATAKESGLPETEMFLCVQHILSHGYVAVDEYVSVGLLYSFCRYIRHYPVKDLQWTATVKTLYELPHQYILYKPGKKSTERYFLQVVPEQLRLFTEEGDHNYTSTVEEMHAIFVEALFLHISSTTLVAHVTQLVEAAPPLPDACILYLFREIISNLAAAEIQKCETVYRALVQPPYAHLAEQLVSVLAQVNRALSPGFYEGIYAEAVAAKEVNWTLVSYIMRLQPSLYTGWKSIVDGTGAFSAESLLQVAQNLVACFDGAREVQLFMLEVYPYAALYAGWADDETMDLLAQKIDLPARTILSLAQQYLTKSDVPPMSLVLRILARSSEAKQKQCALFFSDVSQFKEGWAEVVYQVLSLYPKTEGVSDILGKSKYDVYLAFRLEELEKCQSQKSLEKLLKNHISHLHEKSLGLFLERWLVLVDQKCPQVYPELFAQMFKKWGKDDFMAFLSGKSVLLCEMPSFLAAFSLYLQENKTPFLHDILVAFPAVVFRKFFACFSEDLITEAMKKEGGKKSEDSSDARLTLKRLLTEPTLLTRIEKSFASLYEFVDSSEEDALEATLDTAETIWIAHLRNIKHQLSADFVADAVAHMKKLTKKDTSSLLLAHRFLSVPTDKIDLSAPTRGFVGVVCSAMKAKNFEKYLVMLESLAGVSACETEVSSALRKFGSEPLSASAKATMFSLVAKTAGESKAEYVLALFLALQTQSAECRAVHTKALAHYLRQLSDSVFERCFVVTLAASETSHRFTAASVDALAVMAPLVGKDMPAGLITGALSRFLLQCGNVTRDTAAGFLAMLFDLVAFSGWAFSPYVVEIVLNVADKMGTVPYLDEELYVATTKLVSNVISHHRLKFSWRYHVVTKVASGLLVPLSEKGQLLSQNGKITRTCAAALSRLWSTLCEPHSHASARSDALTSQAAVYKSALRKHAHVILVNYIHFRLELRFPGDANDALVPGLFSLIGLLSQAELELVSQCLDSLGRTYFQALYAQYRDHGKWRE